MECTTREQKHVQNSTSNAKWKENQIENWNWNWVCKCMDERFWIWMQLGEDVWVQIIIFECLHKYLQRGNRYVNWRVKWSVNSACWRRMAYKANQH
jgi:hypothetical protein